MKKSTLFLLFLFTITTATMAQEQPDPQPYVKKGFCIILSTKSYTEAKKTAEKAAKQFSMRTDYRGLTPNKKSGLTMSKKECEENSWDYPAYISRGRYDDGEYISIEYSNAFTGFAKGYYIVVVSSGEADTNDATLKKVKKLYKTAYVKQTDVYIGCMH